MDNNDLLTILAFLLFVVITIYSLFIGQLFIGTGLIVFAIIAYIVEDN